MRGFAAELSGARDWMKVATAGEGGIRLYTCISKSISKTIMSMKISILIMKALPNRGMRLSHIAIMLLHLRH